MIIKGLVFWLYFLSNIVVGINIIRKVRIGEKTLECATKYFFKILEFLESNLSGYWITRISLVVFTSCYVLFFYYNQFFLLSIATVAFIIFSVLTVSKLSIVEYIKKHSFFFLIYALGAVFTYYYCNQIKEEDCCQDNTLFFLMLFALLAHLLWCICFPPLCRMIIACTQRIIIALRICCFESKIFFGFSLFYYFIFYPIVNHYFF